MPADYRGFPSLWHVYGTRAAALVAVLSLAGCATCREHPVMCAASAVVVGIAAAQALDRGERRAPGERRCFDLPASACQ